MKTSKIKTALMLAPFAAVSLAGAQDTSSSFDTSKLESTSTAILGVGALIAVGFAIYKVGKRGLGKV